MASAKSVSYTRNAAGNVLTDSRTGALGVTFQYDVEGRLSKTFQTSNTAEGATYKYDARSRLASRVVTHAVAPLSTTTLYIHDLDDHIIAETDASGTTLREYIWVDDLPLAVVANANVTPAIYYVHTDHLLRPARMTDNVSAGAWDVIYKPFGEVNNVAIISAATDLRFPEEFVLAIIFQKQMKTIMRCALHKRRYAALVRFYIDVFRLRRAAYAHIVAFIIVTSLVLGMHSTKYELLLNASILAFILLIIAFDGLYFIIPDCYLLCLLALSLIEHVLGSEALLLDCIGAGILGLAGSWLIAKAYERLRNRSGLGLGDVKFLGLAGFMTSYVGLNAVVIIATTSALLSVLISQHQNGYKLTGDFALPFGCHIALGIWVTRALSTLT